MRAYFSNTVIASSNLALGRVGPSGFAIDGEPSIDPAEFFRAANATLFGRGDGAVTCMFSVVAVFSIEAALVSFLATHRESLPLQGDLVLIDDEDATAVRMADAIRAVSFGQVRGLSVQVSYKFTGAMFIGEDVPDAPTESDTLKTHVVNLSAADESTAVVFDTPFGAVPKSIAPTVESPIGGPVIAVGVSAVDANGFTAIYGAAIPGAGYKLRWSATL